MTFSIAPFSTAPFSAEAGRILKQRGQLSKEMHPFRESMEEALNFDYFKFSK